MSLMSNKELKVSAQQTEDAVCLWNVGYGKTKKFVMELKDAEKSNE